MAGIQETLQNTYLLENYYDKKAKEFYELKMGSMADKECTTNLLELLRYVLYLKDEKAKVHKFFSGLPLTFRDHIEYDEPRTLEEVIVKLKHFYEQSKRKTKYQHGWKGKDKGKGKWQLKRTWHHNVEEKENFSPYKKFNIVRQGHGSQQ